MTFRKEDVKVGDLLFYTGEPTHHDTSEFLLVVEILEDWPYDVARDSAGLVINHRYLRKGRLLSRIITGLFRYNSYTIVAHAE